MYDASFIVDGFNLYHSLKQAQKDTGLGTRWLNLRGLMIDAASGIRQELGLPGKIRISSIHYYSAYATYQDKLDPDTVERHKQYVSCLQDTGIIVSMSAFGETSIQCPACGGVFSRYEEKETDVGVATRLVDLAFRKTSDVVVIVSGDTDLAPAFRVAREANPDLKICALFPYARGNKVVGSLADATVKISRAAYVKHQFSDPYIHSSGMKLSRPPKW